MIDQRIGPEFGGFGFSDRPAAELGADALIDHYDDLVPALERLWRR